MTELVGIDVGGTFTDLYYSSGAGPDGDRVLKVPSTPDDPSRGLIDALGAAGLDIARLDAILHGTTIATNAVIERRGATCALITTKGFRDILELGRRDRQRMCGLTGVQQPSSPPDEVGSRRPHGPQGQRADRAGRGRASRPRRRAGGRGRGMRHRRLPAQLRQHRA
ncbi:hydantoinase/oxoprolinase N-terminal domain-containing protein [Seohaeicola zhoushanensis]